VTSWRRDFLRHHSEELLIEEVVPYRSIRVRAVWPQARRWDVTATLSVEAAADPGTAWIQEAVSFSLGAGPVARWADRWLVAPLFQVGMWWKTRWAFRSLRKQLAR
jgi:hypothetical protein